MIAVLCYTLVYYLLPAHKSAQQSCKCFRFACKESFYDKNDSKNSCNIVGFVCNHSAILYIPFEQSSALERLHMLIGLHNIIGNFPVNIYSINNLKII